jgi:hypothetical protein
LSSWSRDPLEKLIVARIVKVPAFYGLQHTTVLKNGYLPGLTSLNIGIGSSESLKFISVIPVFMY